MQKRELVAGILLTLSNFFASPANGRNLGGYRQLREVTNTPQKMAEFLHGYLVYIHDEPRKFINHRGERIRVGSNYMYEPEDTYLRGGGDCEDYAELAADWMVYHGYEAYVISLGDTRHTVCAVRDGGKWVYLSNDGYFSGYTSLEALIRDQAFSFPASRRLLPDPEEYTGYVVVSLPSAVRGRTWETYQALQKSTGTPQAIFHLLKELRIGDYSENPSFNARPQFRIVQQPFYTYLYGKGTDSDWIALAATWLKEHGHQTKMFCYKIRFPTTKDSFGEMYFFFCAVKEGETWSRLSTSNYKGGYESIGALLDDCPRKLLVEYYELRLDERQRFHVLETHHISQ